jgi:protein-tyrosine phosphatase
MFVCHGNICRSPMAEFTMRDLAMRAGRANEFRIQSSATTTEELGNPVHPGTRRVLAEHGIACVGKTARQLRRDECGSWDLFVCMDDENVRHLRRILGKDPQGKVHKLLEYAPGNREGDAVRDVADPWYTGDFQATWDDVLAGCTGLLERLR